MGAGADFKVDVGFGDTEVVKKTFRHLLVIMLAGMDDAMRYGVVGGCCALIVCVNRTGNGGEFHEVWPGSGDGHQLHCVPGLLCYWAWAGAGG